MGTIREFPCPHCSATIYVSLPANDPTRRCAGCGETVSLPQKFAPENNAPVEDAVDRYNQVRSSLQLFIWGVVIYFLNFSININLSSQVSIIQFSTIGDILFLVAFLRLKRIDRFGVWPKAGLYLCGLQLASRASAIVGTAELFNL